MPRPPTVAETMEWARACLVWDVVPFFGIGGLHMGVNDNDGSRQHPLRPAGDPDEAEG
jgi:hypothetical protein